MIHLIHRQRKIPVDLPWLEALSQELLKLSGYESFALGIMLTTNRTIKHYNATYRHKNVPTDILSFSYHPQHVAGTPIIALHEEDKNLGDLILSLEYIQNYSKKEGISFEHRLTILIIHGVCHLLGYDHESDSDYLIMKAQEEELFRKLPTSLRR